VPGEFGNDDVSGQGSCRHTTVHEACWRGSLNDAILAGPAGIARANGPSDAQDGWYDIERLARGLPHAVEPTATTGAGTTFRLNDDVVSWQVFGKEADIARRRWPASQTLLAAVRSVVISGDRDSRKIAKIKARLCRIDRRKHLRSRAMDQPLKAGYFLLKVGYPGIANQNHPAQLLDILRKLIGWKRHAETYHTGMVLQANTMGLSGFRRSLYGLLLNPCPVQPGNEQIELGDMQIAPSFIGGKTNLPLSNHFVDKIIPEPSQ